MVHRLHLPPILPLHPSGILLGQIDTRRSLYQHQQCVILWYFTTGYSDQHRHPGPSDPRAMESPNAEVEKGGHHWNLSVRVLVSYP